MINDIVIKKYFTYWKIYRKLPTNYICISRDVTKTENVPFSSNILYNIILFWVNGFVDYPRNNYF